MKIPRISICIPVYNVEDYLSTCLDSVINQTLTDIEIILVDDGSLDRSSIICSEYAAKDKRIILIKKEMNEGLLLARKSAIEKASGQYIFFLDSDDYLERNDALQVLYNLIESEKVDILQFSVNIISTGNSRPIEDYERVLRVNELAINGSENIITACVIDKKFTWNVFNKIYRSFVCKEALFYIPDVHIVAAEDVFLFILFSTFSDSYKAVNTPSLYCYRLGSGVSTTFDITLHQFNDFCKQLTVVHLLRDFFVSFNKISNYQEILNKIENNFLCHAVWRFSFVKKIHVQQAIEILERYIPSNKIIELMHERLACLELSRLSYNGALNK